MLIRPVEKRKMKNNNVINEYAKVIYAYYTSQYKVKEIADYPSYIADEIGLGFNVPFIKKMDKEGLLKISEEEIELTEEGKVLIDKNPMYIDLFNMGSPYVSLIDFEDRRKALGEGKSFNEIVIDILEEKLTANRQAHRYVAVESLHTELGNIYLEEGEKEKALAHYMATLCYSVSGIKEYKYVRQYRNKQITAKELLVQYDNCVYVDPYILDGMKTLKESYRQEMVDEVYDEEKLAYTLCSRERFIELMESVLDGKYENKVWQSVISEVFRKRMKFKPKKKRTPQNIENKEEYEVGVGTEQVDDSKIINTEDVAATEMTSDAMLEEIAEEGSKK